MRPGDWYGSYLWRGDCIAFGHGRRCVLVTACLMLAAGCTTVTPNPMDWSLQNPFSEPAAAGSAQWWNKHKSKAEFVPRKGYTVAGVDGYFDQNGRRFNSQVERDALTEEPEGLLPDIDPRIAYGKVKGAVGLGPNQQVAKETFAEAETLFAEKRYAVAQRRYRDASTRWPKSRLEEDSLFMVGESFFFRDKYDDARDAYAELIDKYPNTRHLNLIVDRQWDIAQYWEKKYFDSWQTPLSVNAYDKTRPTLDTIGHALKMYESIRLNDPTGPRADDAIMATAGIHFRRKRYADADYHYTLLRTEYPRSEFQFEAHLLGLQAKLHEYQGPDYDGSPLDEAKLLAKQLRTQFAGRLSAEEKERLRKVQAELNMKIAQRDLRMAEYYDDKRQFGAAREYYGKLIEQYPDSELAQHSRDRLAQISDKPSKPPQRLSWFVELFPESRERTRVARIPELQDSGRRLARAPQDESEEGREPVNR